MGVAASMQVMRLCGTIRRRDLMCLDWSARERALADFYYTREYIWSPFVMGTTRRSYKVVRKAECRQGDMIRGVNGERYGFSIRSYSYQFAPMRPQGMYSSADRSDGACL